jgi:hypothetical protein
MHSRSPGTPTTTTSTTSPSRSMGWTGTPLGSDETELERRGHCGLCASGGASGADAGRDGAAPGTGGRDSGGSGGQGGGTGGQSNLRWIHGWQRAAPPPTTPARPVPASSCRSGIRSPTVQFDRRRRLPLGALQAGRCGEPECHVHRFAEQRSKHRVGQDVPQESRGARRNYSHWHHRLGSARQGLHRDAPHRAVAHRDQRHDQQRRSFDYGESA